MTRAGPARLSCTRSAQGEPWKVTDWFRPERGEEPGTDSTETPSLGSDDSYKTGSRRDREPVVLKPGGSCLAYLCSNYHFTVEEKIKIVMRPSPADDAQAWGGVLETPPTP